VLLSTLILLPLAASADERCTKAFAELERALVRTAADRIDSSLGAVAKSTRALGDTYGRLTGTQGDPPDSERWLARRTTKGSTTGLRTWPAEFQSPAGLSGPYPSLYSFNGSELSEPVLRELDLFERLVPTFRTAYESFPFSWVYVTTADNAMMIYPPRTDRRALQGRGLQKARCGLDCALSRPSRRRDDGDRVLSGL
jgi:hypothetical protein